MDGLPAVYTDTRGRQKRHRTEDGKMTLQDHFRPPLGARRHWSAFHNAWATYIASDLNRRLPERYFAEPNVQFGIEIDVATFEESDAGLAQPAVIAAQPPDAGSGWSGRPPARSVPITILDDVSEVL